MSVRGRLSARLAALAPRERRILAGGTVAALAVLLLYLGLVIRDDLVTLRARVTARERELGQVRRLAALLLRHGAAVYPSSDGVSLLGRLETLAAGTVGRERIAGMTPVEAPAGDGGEEGVALRVSHASLEEIVRLLHGLEAGPPPLPVTRLELRKYPDAPSRFEATVEVARPGSGP